MTTKVLTKAQRIERAAERMEEAMADLLQAAKAYREDGTNMHFEKRAVMEKARAYARKVDALTRIRS
jgi:hypothetical protein